MGLEDYQELRAFLARFGRRVKLLKGIEGLILILLCALLLFALGFAIQELQPLFPYAALFYSIVTAGLLSAILSWTLLRGLRKVREETAALYIEKKCPHLKNNLINSLQLYPQIAIERQPAGVSQSMVLALLSATRKQIREIPVAALTNSRRIQTQTRLFSFLLIPVAAAVFLHPTSAGKTFKLILHPFADMPSAHVALDVHPKGTRLLRGSTLAVTAATTGAVAALSERHRAGSDGSLVHSGSPLGIVSLREETCTDCGACTAVCPTEALRYEEGAGGEAVVSFEAAQCIACGNCVPACPEGAFETLGVRAGVELAALATGRIVLKRAASARCRRCGAAIAPEAMLSRIRTLLEGEEASAPLLATLTELCSDCRALG